MAQITLFFSRPGVCRCLGLQLVGDEDNSSLCKGNQIFKLESTTQSELHCKAVLIEEEGDEALHIDPGKDGLEQLDPHRVLALMRQEALSV